MPATEPNVIVRPVKGWRDRRAFIQFPYELYKDAPYWVPPLRLDTATLINPKKNAFFAHGDMQLFLARNRRGTVVGRIAAIKNGMHLSKYDDGVGFFGFFESIEDGDVSKALFDTAAGWLRGQGLSTMRGPVNPSMNDTAGLLVGGFDRQPSILMPYNLSYYEGLLNEYGFSRVMTMWAYYAHTKTAKMEKLKRGTDLIMRKWPSLSIRNMDMSRFEDEARLILDMYNDAWSDNWGHVPMTEAEFQQMAKELKQIVDPRLAIIVEDDGEAVGFAVSLPDLNYAFKTMKSGRLLPVGILKLLFLATSGVIREIRMPLMGVRKSHHGKGLDAMLVYQTSAFWVVK
jgi:GNAT superfamily N-acetyltransferase